MIELSKLRRQLLALVMISFVMALGFGVFTWWVAVEAAGLDERFAIAAGLIITLLLASALSTWISQLVLQPLEFVQRSLQILNNPEGTIESLPQPDSLLIGREITKLALKDIYDMSVNQHDIQQSMLNENELLKTLVDGTAAAVIAIDRNGLIKFANSAARDLAVDSLDEVIGAEYNTAYKLEFPDHLTLKAWIQNCQNDIVNASQTWQRIKMIDSDEQTRYFDAIASFSKEESHGLETVLILVDFTEIYEADNREVSFVSLAVHELRSLITVLRGYIEVFQEEIGPNLDHEHTQFMNKMSVSSAQLSTFVNNLLNVARLENDQMKVHMQKEDWLEVVNSSREDMELRATVRNRHLTFKLPKKLPPVAVDRVSIYEVMSNLIDNAIKYSHDGGEIVVTVSDKGEGVVETTVQDFGIGIPSGVMRHLFDKFYRSHRSRENIGGTGLGLYLSKHIIEAHTGVIWVKSVEGEGTTFGFTVPTYDSVADQLKKSNDGSIIRSAHGWINNHGNIRR